MKEIDEKFTQTILTKVAEFRAEIQAILDKS